MYNQKYNYSSKTTIEQSDINILSVLQNKKYLEKFIFSIIFYDFYDKSLLIEKQMFSDSFLQETIDKIIQKNFIGVADIIQEIATNNPHLYSFVLNKEKVQEILSTVGIKTVFSIFYKFYLKDLILLKINEVFSHNHNNLQKQIKEESKIEENYLNKIEQEIEKIKNEINKLKNEKTKEKSSVEKYLSYQQEILSQKTVAGGIVGHESGLVALDLITRGFKPKEYVIIGARPSMGKTSFALDITAHNLLQSKKVLFFSIEMPAEQIIGRLIPKVNPLLTINHSLYFENFSLVKSEIDKALTILNSNNLIIEDFEDYTKITISLIESKYLEYEKKYGKPDLVIIDYMQRISAYEKGNVNLDSNDNITNVSSALKNMSKKYKNTWIVLSQLNRGLELRANKRPSNADLRGSGSLEQDADLILFPYRPNVYLIEKLKEQISKKPDNKEIVETLEQLESLNEEPAEIIVGKNRNGMIGSVPTTFYKKQASFILNSSEENLDDLDCF